MNSRLFLVSCGLLLLPGRFARAADGPLQARTWDFETTIPSGGYRAQKAIDLEGDWSPKIERGAVLDGIEFHGRALRRPTSAPSTKSRAPFRPESNSRRRANSMWQA